MKQMICALLLGLAATGCEKASYGNVDHFTTASPQEAQMLIASDPMAVIIDVRPAGDYRSETGHLPNALSIPLDELPHRMGELERFKRHPVIVYDNTGKGGADASRMLMLQGHRPYNIDSGLTKWKRQNLPVVVERK